MAWSNGQLKQPDVVKTPHDTLKGALSSLSSPGIAALRALESRAQWPQPELASQADRVTDLRAELDKLTTSGQQIAVHNWTFGAGKEEDSGTYLSPPNAVKRLAEKLRDGADLRTGAGGEAVCLMVCAGQIGDFVSKLAKVCDVLPAPGFTQALNTARAHAGNEAQKMQKPGALTYPAWPEAGDLVEKNHRESRSLLLAEMAMLAAHKTRAPVDVLAELVRLREKAVTELAEKFDEMGSASAPVWSWQGSGGGESLAAALESSSPPDHSFIFTAAVLLTGADLTFLKGCL
ncbi:TPA: hypothetical protein N3A35_003847 [Salmonella enterica subsp. salamae serovar 16:m,t:e,n,x]|nr:hypothetical protein [Salmonella enterica subsp. salamae serovar 16:m,t:e,n,x]